MLQSESQGATASKDYLEHLWWLMHHSYAPGRMIYALTSYLDDSGSDDLSPLTTIGGPVMSRVAFCEFNGQWGPLLKRHRISWPVKMTDFVRPHGRYAGMYPELKMAFLREASKLINEHKLYSIAVEVAGPEFDAQLSEGVRKNLIGPYALAFFSAVLAANSLVSQSRLFANEIISFLVDSGFSHSGQLVLIHAAILEVARRKHEARFVGAMGFDTDERVSALQAADMVAWSGRRKALNALCDEFEPLNDLVDPEQRHAAIPIPKEGIQMFAIPINNWLTACGRLPSFSEFFR
jgi:hypothetical protein